MSECVSLFQIGFIHDYEGMVKLLGFYSKLSKLHPLSLSFISLQ